jgi:hypothetical protein
VIEGHQLDYNVLWPDVLAFSNQPSHTAGLSFSPTPCRLSLYRVIGERQVVTVPILYTLSPLSPSRHVSIPSHAFRQFEQGKYRGLRRMLYRGASDDGRHCSFFSCTTLCLLCQPKEKHIMDSQHASDSTFNDPHEPWIQSDLRVTSIRI